MKAMNLMLTVIILFHNICIENSTFDVCIAWRKKPISRRGLKERPRVENTFQPYS